MQLLPLAPPQSTALEPPIKAVLFPVQAAMQPVSPVTDQPTTSVFPVPILPISCSLALALPAVLRKLSEMEPTASTVLLTVRVVR